MSADAVRALEVPLSFTLPPTAAALAASDAKLPVVAVGSGGAWQCMMSMRVKPAEAADDPSGASSLFVLAGLVVGNDLIPQSRSYDHQGGQMPCEWDSGCNGDSMCSWPSSLVIIGVWQRGWMHQARWAGALRANASVCGADLSFKTRSRLLGFTFVWASHAC